MRKLWESYEKVVRKLLESCEEVVRKMLESCEKVVRQLRKSWEKFEKVVRKFWEGGRGGQWEAWNWSCDLRANGRPKKNCTRWHRTTDKQTEMATLWLNRRSGADSVKINTKKWKKLHMTLNMWHMTCDEWHVTKDTWYVTYDKFQVSSSYGFGGKVYWRFRGKGWVYWN